MRVEIDPRSPQPPSEQIEDQVRFAIAAGRLLPGERLPSVRGLAAQALVNPNTVAKAYRELEREGTVETRPGDGVFVADRAVSRCASIRAKTIGDRVSRVVEEAIASGLSGAEVQAIVTRALGTPVSVRADTVPVETVPVETVRTDSATVECGAKSEVLS